MNDITKYKNAMNKVRFHRFGIVESRIFFALCSKLKYKDSKEIILTFDELRQLSDYDKKSSTKEFISSLEKTYNRIIETTITIRTYENGEPIIEKFLFFSAYRIDGNTKTTTVGVNPIFQFLVNEGWDEGKWTVFYLKDYVSLKSEYSQRMFRLCKQWRVPQRDYDFKKSGHKWGINEWRELLDVPENYEMHHIDKKVLNPIREELSRCFENLEIKKFKEGKGNRITHIEFTFKPETQEYGDFPNADAPDARTKAEKIADIEAKEEAGTATLSMTNLKNVMKNERKWMQKNGIPDGDGVSDESGTNNPVPMPDEIRRKYSVGEKVIDDMKILKDDERGEVNATFLTNIWERLFGKKD